MGTEIGGWGFPANSRKAHYFAVNDSFSACGSYGFYFARREPETGKRSPDDCVRCVKKLPKVEDRKPDSERD